MNWNTNNQLVIARSLKKDEAMVLEVMSDIKAMTTEDITQAIKKNIVTNQKRIGSLLGMYEEWDYITQFWACSDGHSYIISNKWKDILQQHYNMLLQEALEKESDINTIRDILWLKPIIQKHDTSNVSNIFIA